MQKSIRPLHIFFFGMVFGAGALYWLTDVRWPKAPNTAPAAPVVAVTPKADVPAPIVASAPISVQTTPVQADVDPEKPENTGIPANIIPPELVPPQEPTLPSALLIPVQGIGAAQLHDAFSQARSEGRTHEAIDILSPAGTPVLAADDGRIVKLFDSKPGGLTIYQFDPSDHYAYYYAHLKGYAAGVVEGKLVKRGELLGYVGSTGNASPAAPHLHFAIFELGPEKNWWQGKAINPYPLLGGF